MSRFQSILFYFSLSLGSAGMAFLLVQRYTTPFITIGGIVLFLLLTGLFLRKVLFLAQSLDKVDAKATMASLYQERYRQIFMNVDRAVIIFRREGEEFIIVDLNPLVEKIENIPKEDMLGKSIRNVFPGAREFEILDILEEVYQTGKYLEVPMKYYHSDYSRGYRENHIFKLATGELVSIYRDITKDVEFKKELVQAKKTAEKEQKTRADFMANMSHELRTPLNGIMMGNELLNMTRLDDEQTELSEIIQKSAENLLDIINAIMDMTNIELNRMIIREQNLNLEDLLRFSARIYENMAKQKNVEVRIMIDHLINHTYIGDPHRIRQIFMNLIHNAIKFTDTGSVRISLNKYDGHIDLPEGVIRDEYDFIEFVVEDTGIGIPEDGLRNIFEKFMQLDMSTTKKYGGSGIGLSITQALLKLMNGKIRVESKPGEGSRFSVYLPLWKSSDIAVPEKTRVETKPIPPKEERHILIVEDNIINQSLTERMLHSFGFITYVSSNGLEAVEQFWKNPRLYDLVLMDIQMPIMNGYEASRKIREIEHTTGIKKTPIVALTAYVSDEDKDRCFENGMDDFLAKPVDKSELQRCLYRNIQSTSVN